MLLTLSKVLFTFFCHLHDGRLGWAVAHQEEKMKSYSQQGHLVLVLNPAYPALLCSSYFKFPYTVNDISFFYFLLTSSPAEAFFKHSIEIKKNSLGSDHPSLVKVHGSKLMVFYHFL